MAAPTTTRATVRLKVAKKLYKHRHPISSTTTAASGVANGLTDSLLTGAQRAEDFIGAWIYTTSATVGGLLINTLNRVVYTDFSTATAVHLRMLPAGGGNYPSGHNYEIHYKFSPKVIEDMINELLENMRHPVRMVVTDVEDGNMEASDAALWLASGAHSITGKTTVADFVFFGSQSLRCTGGATGVVSNLNSNRLLRYNPEESVLVEALVMLPSSSANVRMRLKDVTNTTYITDATATTNKMGWSVLRFVVEIPATCESVQVDFDISTGHECMINYVCVLPTRGRLFEYPMANDTTLLERGEDLDPVCYYWPTGNDITLSDANNAFEQPNGTMRTWSHLEIIRDDLAARPWRFTLSDPMLRELDRAIWVEGYVDYPTLSSDSTTTSAPEDLLVGLVYADLLEDWAQEDLDDGRLDSYQAKMAKALDVRKKYGPRARHMWKDRGRVNGALR